MPKANREFPSLLAEGAGANVSLLRLPNAARRGIPLSRKQGGKIVLAAAAALLLAACSTEKPATPSAPAQATTMCGRATPLNAADRKELCTVIDAVHEFRLPEDRMATANTIYRVLLVNAAQPITSIRVEWPPHGAAADITVRQLRGTHMITDKTTEISAEQLVQIRNLVSTTGLWSQAIDQDAPTLNASNESQGFAPCRQSSYVVVEASAPRRYHLSLAHCASTKRLEDFAMGLYNIAAADVPALTQDLGTTVD